MSEPVYDPDEALRMTKVELMLEGDTYAFDVHNEAGSYMLVLIRHDCAGKAPFETVACRHAGNDSSAFEPCTMMSENLKDAARRSIKEHRTRFH